ncbi:50S ribosomal protein L28 [Candidatus Microgenomates bacterium]|nr:50S ribosomal protein L28 [Candidatus Microgenomates bacterium]
MAYRCEICGKTKQFGHNVSFSQRKTQKIWKPNLQTKRIQLGPNKTTVKVCARCLKQIKAATVPSVTAATPVED